MTYLILRTVVGLAWIGSGLLLNNLVADSAQPTLAASIAPAYFVTLAVVGVVLVVVGCRETAPATTPRFH